MSLIIRKYPHGKIAVLKDHGTKEIARYRGKTALARAKQFCRQRGERAEVDEFLFTAGPGDEQAVSWIRDCGDGSEPEEMGDNSLFRISDSRDEMILTGEEMTSFARLWLATVQQDRHRLNFKTV